MENINKIKEKLNTRFLGKDIKYLKEVDSTQDYIKRELKNGIPNGIVVLSDNQTKGKGTNGRKWYTKSGENLTFSFLLKPNTNIRNFERLTIMIAQAMIRAIEYLYGYTLQIKYPNDIVINNKKLRGNINRKFYNG